MHDAAHKASPLYPALLGDSWHALPDDIRRMHDVTGRLQKTPAFPCHPPAVCR